MSREPKRLVCVACSIFREELEKLQADEQTSVPVRFLGSMLHMTPDRLEQRLQAAIQEERAKGNQVLLAYGDCCPHMTDMEEASGITRTEGINCVEIILGRETYRTMRRKGAFFLMPEWTVKWRTVFQDTLGLRDENARSFMRDMHTCLVYLDTGLIPLPERELAELVAYTGLPMQIMKVSLRPLLENFLAAAARIPADE